MQAVNEASKRVLAVDVPTGVNADTGEVTDSAIRAECTVTFGLPKLGLLLYPGAEYAGRLIVDDIGFPKTHLAWRSDDMPERMWMSAEYVSTLMRVRHPNSHKGDYGRVLVIAGSAGLLGAGELAARAAARCGAGLVTWGGPHPYIVVAPKYQVMTLRFPRQTGYLGLQAASTIVTAFRTRMYWPGLCQPP